MKTFSVMLALVLLLVVVVGIANADKAEDTVNLVDKAVAMFKETGKRCGVIAIVENFVRLAHVFLYPVFRSTIQLRPIKGDR